MDVSKSWRERMLGALLSVTLVVGLMPSLALAEEGAQEQAGGDGSTSGIVAQDAQNAQEQPAEETAEAGAAQLEGEANGAQDAQLATTYDWSGLKDALSDSGSEPVTIKLDNEVTYDGTSGGLSVNGVKTLDLNGHTINGTSDSGGKCGSVITVNSGATLTVVDSSASGAGKITGGIGTVIQQWAINSYCGGGVYNSGTLSIESGAISGNQAGPDSYTDSCFGGGVYNNGGTFTMSGGTISGNRVPMGNGGGVYNSGGGTFTISGGTISGNEAKQTSGGGGGVWNGGTLRMEGGTISDNTGGLVGGGVHNKDGGTITMSGGTISGNKVVSSSGSYGGGVGNNNGCTFTMSGGTISGNAAANAGNGAFGGGVCNFNGGTFTMSGGTISGNTALTNGGGVFNRSDASIITISSGTISGNEASGYGGGIYNESGSLTLAGGAAVTGNTSKSWAAGGGVYCLSNSKPVTLAGAVDISDNATTYGGTTFAANLCLGGNSSPQQVTLSEDFSVPEGKRIGVTTMGQYNQVGAYQFTTDGTKVAEQKQYFVSDNAKYGVKYVAAEGGTGHLGTHELLVTVGTQQGIPIYGTGGTATYAVAYKENPTATSVEWTAGSAPEGVTVSFSDDMKTLTVTTTSEVDAGSYAFKVIATISETPVESNEATLTISPKPINVKADDKTSIVDSELVPLTYTVDASTPLREGDELIGELATTAKKDVVGDYDITQGTLDNQEGRNPNYKITFTKGTYSVIRGIIPTADCFDFTAPEEGRPIYDGTAKAAEVKAKSTVTGMGAVTVYYSDDGGETWSQTAPKAAGSYTVKIDVAEGEKYTAATGLTSPDWTFEIAQRAVTVTADGKSKAYGEADPVLTATVAGTVGADTVAYELSRVEGEDLGDYTITASGEVSQGNYSVTFAPGTLTISKAKVAVPVAAVGLTYDGSEQIGVALPSGESRYALCGNTGVNAGSYTAMASLADGVHYEWDLEKPTADNQYIAWSIGSSVEAEGFSVNRAALDVIKNAYEKKMGSKAVSVELRVAIEGASASDLALIQARAGSKKLASADAELIVTVNGERVEDAGDANDILIAVTYRFDFANKADIQTFRAHNGVVAELTETPNADGEFVRYNEDAGTVTVTATKYSAYSFAYNEVGGSSDPGSGTGGDSAKTGDAVGAQALALVGIAIAAAVAAGIALTSSRRRRER